MQLPPPPPPPKSKMSTKLIAIIAVVIVIIAVGSVAGILVLNPSLNPIAPPFDFDLSISDSSGTAMQGNSIETTVYVTKSSGNSQTVTLSADSGSSGVQCNFNPSSSSTDYSSTMTMSVPSYTSSGAYSVTITASGGGKTYSKSYTISVLSAKVSVSGTVETTGLGTSPSGITFADTQTGLTYTGSLSGNSYSITLDNQHTYAVTVSWNGLLWSTGTYSGGSVYIYAPVGSTTMSENFSG
jgi:hypothetical protein